MKDKLEELIYECRCQIFMIENNVELLDIDDHGNYLEPNIDEHGNYLDANNKIIDINNMKYYGGQSVKEALDYWKQKLQKLEEVITKNK